MKFNVEALNTYIAISTTIFVLFKCIYDFYYKYRCQKFYKISNKYFSFDTTSLLIKLFLLLLLLFSMKYSFFDGKSVYGLILTNIAKGILICSSFIILLYMYFDCYTQLSILVKNNIGIMFKGILVYTLIYFIAQFCNCSCLLSLLVWIFIIFFIITLVNLFIINLKNKSVYEVFKYNNLDFLVLSDKDNYRLCVKYDIEDIDDEICLKLFVKKYLLLSENIIFEKQDFNTKSKFKLKVIEE